MNKRKFAVLVIIIFLTLFSSAAAAINENLTLHFPAIRGEAVLIELPGQRNMLIDAGYKQDGEELLRYLEERDINKLDFVLVSYPGNEHIGGLNRILRRIEVEDIYLPPLKPGTETFREILKTIRRQRIDINDAYRGVNIIEEKNLTISILSPIKYYNYRMAKNYSAVVKIDHHNNSFIFTGDAGEAVEKQLINSHLDIKVDLLKVADHGSRRATSAFFVKVAAPRYAILCTDENSPRTPSALSLSKLKYDDVTIYRTDHNGTITVNSDGEELDFRIEKK